MTYFFFLAALVLLLAPMATADVTLDGDDRLTPSLATNLFVTPSAGTITVVLKPTGSAASGGSNCYNGQMIAVDALSYMALSRTSNYAAAGQDRLCAWAYSDAEYHVGATYTVNTFTTLTWHLSGGTLTLYKDGVSVGSIASGTISDALDSLLMLWHSPGSDIDSSAGVLALVQTASTALPTAEVIATGASRLHWLTSSTLTGRWEFSQCADGVSGDGVSFRDTSGNGRHIPGDNGANNSGLSCTSSSWMSYPWGVE